MSISPLTVGTPRLGSLRSWKHSVLTHIYGISGTSARLESMEGMRGVAVLMVFFVHFDALFSNYVRRMGLVWTPLRFLGIVGNAGVDIFFVVSGYLIYGALIRKETGILPFLRRRIERIYPTYLAVFGLYCILSVAFPEASKLTSYHGIDRAVYIVQNLLLLPGVLQIRPMITLSWSLSYEFFFYVLIVVLISTLELRSWRPYRRCLLFVFIWCGYLLLCLVVSRSYVRALMFVVGILLYEALSTGFLQPTLSERGEIYSIVLFACGLIFIYLVDVHPFVFRFLPGGLNGVDSVAGSFVWGPYKTVVLSVSTFWFAAYSFGFDGRLARSLSSIPLRCLGNMSYSYYLIHGVALQGVALTWAGMAKGMNPGVLVVAALAIGFLATWSCSTVLFVTIEKPFSLRRTGRKEKVVAK